MQYRINDYLRTAKGATGISKSFRKALTNGYTIAKIAPIVQLTLPSKVMLLPTRALVRGIGSAFSTVLWACDSSPTAKTGRALLYPWATAVVWTGFCTHDCLMEDILNGVDPHDTNIGPEVCAMIIEKREAASDFRSLMVKTRDRPS